MGRADLLVERTTSKGPLTLTRHVRMGGRWKRLDRPAG